MKLEIRSSHFEVRKASYTAVTSGGFSILYLSDLHFNRYSALITSKMIARISELDPSIILLGGDYVDFEADLVHLNTLLNALSNRSNVYAIAGNHDYTFGVDRIKTIMEANNVGWIENSSATFTINGTSVQIDGSSLLAQEGKADFTILCLHHPVDINQVKNRYNLVFAGHLHGCQFVFWRFNQSLYPGRLFYKWNVLEKKFGNCHYYISKGLGDTLPVRYNCAKEMIFIKVAGSGEQEVVPVLTS